MKVSIIGSGNVATHLAKAFHQNGVEIVSVWSYHYENANNLAEKVSANAINTLADIVADVTDFIVIAIKDDAIADIAKQLGRYEGIVVHTSGSTSIDVLSNCTNFGVLYPLQTFSKDAALAYNNLPLCLEANSDNTLATLNVLANKVTSNVYDVDSDKRKILHLAAVFACNFPNYLFDISQQLLASHQISFDIIKPLIEETANKVQTAFPASVQTGPAIRNDVATLTKHEELLKQYPNWLTIYKLLSEEIKKSKS